MRWTPLVTLLIATALAASQPEPMLIGVKPAEPFVIETDAGYEGISIELWRRIAEREGIEYEFEGATLDGLLDGVASGRYAAGVAAITVTADREARMDFTHPFFAGGLGIAVPAGGRGLSLGAMLSSLVSPGFLTGVAGLAVLLLGVGLVVWLVERRANPDQFGGSPARGLGSGFWFSAVTMTTVGYGDKA
ncbi:MAG: transporter substrate-binding domain-containing protein, partial [Phycisphaerales bacterium]|nr:transporter substrate-binding domain-containing protein [Phycisphaerales bacterium]